MRRRTALLLAAIVAIAWAARHGGLTGPFGEGWQQLGAFYGKQARNYLRYGAAATGFAGVVNAEASPPSEWAWYLHHPPGLGWTMAACFATLGISAFAAKITGMLAALTQVVITYLLVARCLSRRAGLAAAFTTAVVPAGAYFSTHGSELGPQAIALLLLALLLDVRAGERASGRAGERAASPPRVAGTAAAIAGAALYSWAALPIAAAFAWRDARARHWRRVAAIGTAALLPFALHLAQTWWVMRHATGVLHGGSLFEALLNRSVGESRWWASVDAADSMRRLWGHARFDFTRIGLGLAAIGAVMLATARRTEQASPTGLASARPLFFALTALALGYTLPFPQGVLVHRYWLLVALPLVALLVGVVTHVVTAAIAARRVGTWITLALLGAMAWEGLEATLRWQKRDSTPWFEEAGQVVRDLVPAGRTLVTCEPFSDSLEFYAERRVLGDVGDAEIPAEPAELIERLASDLPWFVLALPPVEEPTVAWRRVPPWLEEHAYVAARRQLPGAARELRLYDLSRRPDGTRYEFNR
ncbi:MAG: glycosyltransferase family 39 protein [Planctomycetes bacterium]|nr:glycosyltransferase family 39 protein [Planctomycetota bacterium]